MTAALTTGWQIKVLAYLIAFYPDCSPYFTCVTVTITQLLLSPSFLQRPVPCLMDDLQCFYATHSVQHAAACPGPALHVIEAHQVE